MQAQLEAGNLNAAFDLVVEHYQHRVYRLALAILGDPAAAQDAAQEAFLRIWKGLKGFRGQSALSTWIYTIARNAALTERQSAAARRTLPLDDAPAGALTAGGRVAPQAPTRAGHFLGRSRLAEGLGDVGVHLGLGVRIAKAPVRPLNLFTRG